MDALLDHIVNLVREGKFLISRHGFRELAADDIVLRQVIVGLGAAIVVEEYPKYTKGPCVLVLQRDGADRPLHVLWGLPGEQTEPAVLITAYRPNPDRWSADFLRRAKP